ncbi:MAG: hypothetical protein ACRD2B_08175 [Terriglobia bacterium]
MDEQTFKDRTKRFGLNVIRLVESLPRSRAGDPAACRGRSVSDVMSKLAIVDEEGDESIYWLELLIASESLPAEKPGSG